MNRRQLTDRLAAIGATLADQGFDVRPLVVDEVASVSEVLALESQLGFSLPEAFRSALLEISRHVEFRWFAPKECEFPQPFRSNFCGDLHWSLDFTARFFRDANGWVDNVFSNTDDPYDVVWHNKAAFYEVGNGDYIALDLADARLGRVVYLSHDDGQGHGHELAYDFRDLLDRWVPLACTGGEDWQWLPFTGNLTTRIEPAGEVGDEVAPTAWARSLIV